ncbi:uncharacterized protein [Dermacentor andersoni]|uniref:uncharacterized protein isoform X2 n=1 Tax=Dermacentor andersoni TaxID=34620 RepID=UPI003B3A9FB2
MVVSLVAVPCRESRELTRLRASLCCCSFFAACDAKVSGQLRWSRQIWAYWEFHRRCEMWLKQVSVRRIRTGRPQYRPSPRPGIQHQKTKNAIVGAPR